MSDTYRKEATDGGPAFPVFFEHSDVTSEHFGMTLRDYFAAKALDHFLELEGTGVWNQSLPNSAISRDHAQLVARAAYFMADAMLKARSA